MKTKVNEIEVRENCQNAKLTLFRKHLVPDNSESYKTQPIKFAEITRDEPSDKKATFLRCNLIEGSQECRVQSNRICR